MRTTIDLPDNLYRSLKSRAALSGTTLRELIRGLIEQGLRQKNEPPATQRKRPLPPVIIPQRGIPILPISRSEIWRIEEEEDEAKYGRPD